MRRQRGVALLTALLIVALSTIAATALLKQQYLHMRRSANVLQGQQADAYAQGAELWAQQILKRNAQRNRYDALTEDWAFKLPPTAVPGGSVYGELEDLQGRFNLNSLLKSDGSPDEAAQTAFKRLLAYLELPTELAAQALDWIDVDENPRIPGGAEDLDYQRLNPPYRCANRPFTSPSEVRLLLGMNEENYQILQPFITTLPMPTPVNINTTSAPVLLALIEDLTERQAENLLNEAQDTGFKSLSSFLAMETLDGMNIDTQLLSVNSNFFLLRAQADIERSQRYLTSLLYRAPGGIQVLMRSRSDSW